MARFPTLQTPRRPKLDRPVTEAQPLYPKRDLNLIPKKERTALYDRRWRRSRKLYLDKHPLCVECARAGKVTPATVVDHIIPHRGDIELFWDVDNWQALCTKCHNEKTGRGE